MEAVTQAIKNVKSSLSTEGSEDPFTTVSYKNKSTRSKNTPIVGELNIDHTKVSLRASPKQAYLHVYRLHPDTKVDDLCSYLKPTFPEVSCEQLKSLHPESYSSFKIKLNYLHYFFKENINLLWLFASYPPTKQLAPSSAANSGSFERCVKIDHLIVNMPRYLNEYLQIDCICQFWLCFPYLPSSFPSIDQFLDMVKNTLTILDNTEIETCPI
ncbi:hypothetical protein RI129_001275 [Pyrocoelia pectoralis]|uniref:Uncharacterized protein n=1 Tax=Pyrocoelia pectoralis TaxID=417401 RepID=A0AAN7VTC9_9COLE